MVCQVWWCGKYDETFRNVLIEGPLVTYCKVNNKSVYELDIFRMSFPSENVVMRYYSAHSINSYLTKTINYIIVYKMENIMMKYVGIYLFKGNLLQSSYMTLA